MKSCKIRGGVRAEVSGGGRAVLRHTRVLHDRLQGRTARSRQNIKWLAKSCTETLGDVINPYCRLSDDTLIRY